MSIVRHTIGLALSFIVMTTVAAVAMTSVGAGLATLAALVAAWFTGAVWQANTGPTKATPA